MNTNDATPVLEVRGLSVTFRTGRGLVHAVRDVSLTVHAGETFGVVGESGAGKSALMRTIAGIQPFGTRCEVEGSILIDGRDPSSMPEGERRRFMCEKVGLIFQDPLRSLNPAYRIGTQLTESLSSLHVARGERHERGLDMLRATGFDDPESIWGRYPFQLSGGQRQRIGIGAAAIGRPRLLIGDEPTTALDVTVQHQVLDVLDRIRETTGSAFLLVTHDLDVAAERCDTIAVMREGRIVETGPTEQIVEHPRHPYTRALLACIPSLDGPRLRRLPTVESVLAEGDNE
ncbi:ABC transporter ATP-binding protein [Bifidobacterium sp. SO4]|uniref:ABC transporter ATP-binding protein n=1 Tax=Bifidobacterium sp. SO4 TaxID=2809030 RepID=UPI001BDD6A48|nr:ABC transporter ATP-binding protein [Bifidobacterium sp. SO4]MBT1170637.1 ABC transporter ATP-binding protein [Bifidobacterium sp. SO4]